MFFTSKDINLNKFKLAYPTKGWLKNLKTCSSTEKNIITIVLNNLWQFLPKINEKEKRLMIQKYMHTSKLGRRIGNLQDMGWRGCSEYM